MGHLTYTSLAILQALTDGCPYGMQVMDRTGLPSGTVYPALRRMEKQGWVRCDWEEDGEAKRAGRPRRKYYRLTAEGEVVLAEARKRFRLLAPAPVPSTPG